MLTSTYNNKKFKRFTHYLNIAMKVLFWFCIIAVTIAVIGSLVISFIPEQRFVMIQDGNSFLAITMDEIISYNLKLQGTVNIKSTIISIILGASVVTALLAAIFRQISLILNTVETDNPFDLQNSKRISIIAIIMIVGAFIARAVEYIVFYTIITSHSIQNIHLTYKPDTASILVGMLLLVLAGVFRQGSYLQNEYDSTL
jgi:hypothetical protein